MTLTNLVRAFVQQVAHRLEELERVALAAYGLGGVHLNHGGSLALHRRLILGGVNCIFIVGGHWLLLFLRWQLHGYLPGENVSQAELSRLGADRLAERL